MSEWLALVLLIWKVPVSSLGPDTDYPDRFFAIFQAKSGMGSYNQAMKASFQIFSSSSIYSSPFHSTLYYLNYLKSVLK
jgi:hypothetical protein